QMDEVRPALLGGSRQVWIGFEELIELVFVEHQEGAVRIGPDIERQVDVGKLPGLRIELRWQSKVGVPALQHSISRADLKNIVRTFEIVELDEHVAAMERGELALDDV